MLDLTNRRFGMLTVIGSSSFRGDQRHSHVAVRCDCGAERTAKVNALLRGDIRTCGGDAHRPIDVHDERVRAFTPTEVAALVQDAKEQARAPRWRVSGDFRTYALEAVGTGVMKVGRTRDTFEFRMRKQQFACPVELRMFASSGDDREGEVHRALKDHRAHGEWFQMNDTTVAIVMRFLSPDSLSVIATSGLCGRQTSRRVPCRACGEYGHYAKTCIRRERAVG